MTNLQLIEYLLDQHWEPSIAGRDNDVPKPKIVKESNVTKDDLKTGDVLKLVEAEATTYEAMGFGYTHEQVEGAVTIQCRSADRRLQGTKVDGHVRVFGDRDSNTLEKERHGGLTGEVRRVLLANRKTSAEYNLTTPSEVRNQSGLTGTNHYRGDLTVGLVDSAREIDTSV